MKISPVSFTGLVGATKTYSSSNEYGDFIHTDINYYMFKDESTEDTDKFIKEHSYQRTIPGASYVNDAGITHYENGKTTDSRSVKVIGRLDFTEAEYHLYNKKPEKLPMSKRIAIRSAIEELKREKLMKNI